ncbi:hypothetical protein, partial [Chryseobacterium sp. CH1]|uniref:hypothetical protein n=1 Tax=Chryseobacterium sp. CH1 TaxID=713551 RepID=UPI0010274CB0
LQERKDQPTKRELLWIEIQYDYVVIVLDRPIGNSTGWLGSKSYSDSWDGGAYWTHAGYPGDLTGTQRPTYQTGIALDRNPI